MDSGPTQIPLDFGLNDELTFDTFMVKGNEQLALNLKNLRPSSEFQYLNWWGSPASGKSHLLQAVCHQWAALGLKAIYLEVGELMTMPVDLCLGLEALDLVALDNVDKLTNSHSEARLGLDSSLSEAWQEAIFHLYNRLHQNEKSLLVTSTKPPRDTPFNLKDLKSRLMSGIGSPLNEVDDDTKKAILIEKAAQRKFELADGAAEYILARTSRDMASLMAAFEQIDVDSLVQKRKITIHFLKLTLNTSYIASLFSIIILSFLASS